jgi:hypothetical protein
LAPNVFFLKFLFSFFHYPFSPPKILVLTRSPPLCFQTRSSCRRPRSRSRRGKIRPPRGPARRRAAAGGPERLNAWEIDGNEGRFGSAGPGWVWEEQKKIKVRAWYVGVNKHIQEKRVRLKIEEKKKKKKSVIFLNIFLPISTVPVAVCAGALPLTKIVPTEP